MKLFLVASVRSFTQKQQNEVMSYFLKNVICLRYLNILVNSAFLIVCYMDAISYKHREMRQFKNANL